MGCVGGEADVVSVEEAGSGCEIRGRFAKGSKPNINRHLFNIRV